MTKRIIALLLALIMIFSLAACSDSDDKDDDKDEKVEKKEEKDEDEKADIDPGDEGDETKNDEENKEDAAKDDYEARYLTATFENGISLELSSSKTRGFGTDHVLPPSFERLVYKEKSS